ncbi:hypothetical protein [Streptomyces sp. NPDC059788]|uniref:hypothetical protein n=1 Tax=Streptomyces sp. NPDC059788 TaxID=3346948 RepID=UPI00365CA803
MSTPRSFPDAADKRAIRAWLAARRAESAGKQHPKTLSQLRSTQLKRLAKSVEREAGPVPKDVQRATKLFSGPVFASSYGMVLEGADEHGPAQLPGTGNDTLLDLAINRIFDVADQASSAEGAEDAVLDSALPLGRRVISHLLELSDVLASSDTGVTLSWESKSTARRTSAISAESAERCRKALRAADVDEQDDRLIGTVVGGSKLRGCIELDVAGTGVVLVRTSKDDVPGLLATYADREVAAAVHVLTARSAGGRVHHSYILLDMNPHEAV